MQDVEVNAYLHRELWFAYGQLYYMTIIAVCKDIATMFIHMDTI